MASSKLAAFAEKQKALRAQNRELSRMVDDLATRHNPSVLRKFIGTAIQDGTAYGQTRLYVYLQQKGWMPRSVPIDLLVGTAVQAVCNFFEGPITGVFGDIGSGMSQGALGRLATLHQLEQSEVAGNVCLLVPNPPKAANGG